MTFSNEYAAAAEASGADVYQDSTNKWLVRVIGALLLLNIFKYRYLNPALSVDLGFSVTPERAAFLVLLIGYFVWGSSASKRPVTFVENIMIVFTALSVTSLLISGSDVGETSNRWLTTLFNQCFQPFAIYYIVSRMPYERLSIKTLLGVIALIGVYFSLTGIFEIFGPHSLVFPKYILDEEIGLHFNRARGPLVSSVANGAFLIVAFLTLALRQSVSTGFRKSMTFLCLAPVAIAVYLTYTRSIWVAFGAAVVLMATMRTNIRWIGLSLCAATMVVFFTGMATRLSYSEGTLFSQRQHTIQYRLQNYQVLMNMFNARPFFGIGYGKFLTEADDYYNDRIVGAIDLASNHSHLGGILIELGIVGFSLYFTIISFGGWLCVRTYFLLKDAEKWAFEKSFVVVAAGVLGASMLIGLSSNINSQPLTNALIFLFLGFVAAIERAFKNEEAALATAEE